MENKNFIERLDEILDGKSTYVVLPLLFRRALESMLPKEYESNEAINDNMSLDVVDDINNKVRVVRYTNYFGNCFIITPDGITKSYVDKGYNKGYVFVTLSELEAKLEEIYKDDAEKGIKDLLNKAMGVEETKKSKDRQTARILRIAAEAIERNTQKTGSQLLDEILAEIEKEVKEHPTIEPKLELEEESPYVQGYIPTLGEGEPKGPRDIHPLEPTERKYNAEYDKHLEEIEKLFEGEIRIRLLNEVTGDIDQFGYVHELNFEKDGTDGYMIFIEPADYNGEKPKNTREYITRSGQVAYVSKEQYEMEKMLMLGATHNEEVFGKIMQEILEKSSNYPVHEVYHRGEATGYIRRIEALVLGEKVRKDDKSKNYLYQLLGARKEMLGIEK